MKGFYKNEVEGNLKNRFNSNEISREISEKFSSSGISENGRKFNTLKSKVLLVILIASLVFLISGGNAHATYQSRPGFSALVSTSADTFFKNIRNMETSSGPMGLSATINSSNYTDSSSNGVDVHMMKNTEWGAVAMLALSAYGGGSNDQIQTYSTGNSNYTGVYGMGNSNWEYMATLTVDSSRNSKYYKLIWKEHFRSR